MADFKPEDRLIVAAAKEAGRIGLSYFGKDSTNVWYKSGNSPVSEADKAIDEYLGNTLLAAKPDHGWLSEETEDNNARLEKSRVFIVDPIDGTRGFIAGKAEWCVSIAIVEDGLPVEGVLCCPAMGKTIYAARGRGVYCDGARLLDRSERKTPRVTGSKKLIEHMRNIDGFGAVVTDFIPSLAYRLSLVALGELDGAFARPGASEWDVAAADVILSEAGCKLADKQGNTLSYNKAKTGSPSLVASHLSRQREIFTLANSSGILQ